MSQDDVAIQRAATLLSSNDIKENSNGAALVINTAANAHSVPKLLRANIVALLLPKLLNNDEDLLMKTCWAVNNLCVHDESRNACFAGGALQYFGKVLQHNSTEVIKKACWALTNLARNVEAQKEITRGPVFNGLVNVVTYGKNDEEKGFALQPLCNLVLEANNQMAFKNANGLAATVRLLSSTVPKTQELAVTLISFVTTHHDSIREELVDQGVLLPLCTLLSASKTGKLQEIALNSLVNLSLSEKAEHAILSQGAVRPIVGLLSSEDIKLQQQAAMLLSNLLTNEQIRSSIRYYGWVDPLMKLIRSGNSETLQQVLRVIINIAFDEHCRYLLVKADASSIINAATSQATDSTVFSLSSTAIKNLSVPVSSAAQNEVNQKLSSGGIEYIAAPKVAETGSKVNLSGLDEVLRGYDQGSSKKPTAPPAHNSYKSNPTDNLDELLNEVTAPPPRNPPKSTQQAPTPNRGNMNFDSGIDDLNSLLNEVPPSRPPANKPSGAKPAPVASKPAAKPRNDLNDIDDLLAGIGTTSSSKKPAPKPQQCDDDLDDLLNDIDPRPKSSSKPHQTQLDDIDDLLADMTPSTRKPAQPVGRSSRPAPSDDIDDLLSDFGGGGYGGSGGGSYYDAGSHSGYGGSTDIDDLLSDLNVSSRPSNRPAGGRNTSSGLDVIDDLLADLNG